MEWGVQHRVDTSAGDCPSGCTGQCLAPDGLAGLVDRVGGRLTVWGMAAVSLLTTWPFVGCITHVWVVRTSTCLPGSHLASFGS